MGYIDKTGKIVIPPQFEGGLAFSEGLANVKIGTKFGYIDKSGKFIINPQFETAGKFSGGTACISIDGKYGYINISGIFEIEPIYYKAYRFYEGRAQVQFDESNYGFIDTKGKVLFKTNYIPWSNFNEGLASVRVDQKIGFIDTTGKMVIKNIYSNEIREPIFSDGLCAVSLNGNTIIIDKVGNTIKTLENGHYISNFKQGFAILYSNGSNAYINNKGEKITDFKYKEAHDFSEDLAVAVNENQEFEIIDTKGTVIATFPNACTDVGTDFKYKNGVCKLQTNVSPDSTMVVPANTDNPDYIKQWGGVADIWVDKTGKVVWKGAPWYSCFPPTALVSMADGTQKEIQEILVGDIVLSYNSVEDKFSETLVTEVNCFKGKSHLCRITFSSENELTALLSLIASNHYFIEATAMHPFLTDKGTKRVKELIRDDILFYKDSKSNKIEKVKIEQVVHNEYIANKVFHLKTASGNYIVSGIVVLLK